MSKSLKEIVLTAEFSAIIAVLSQLTLPLGLVPLTGQTFAIGLTATFLKKKTSTLAVLIYLLLGLLGFPVFSGMKGGLGVLFSPTGGYLIGFIFQTWLIDELIEKLGTHYPRVLFSNILGSLVALLFGTFWLKFSCDISLKTAFLSGFLPFLFPELLKGSTAAYLGILLRKRFRTVTEADSNP